MFKRNPIPKFPAPSRDEFYRWMLERLELPDGTPLTRGFFEASRVLNWFEPGDLRALWFSCGRMNAETLNENWRIQLSAKLRLNNEVGLRQLWQQFPFSAQGWHTLRLKMLVVSHSEPLRGNFVLAGAMTTEAAIAEAERLLRRYLEIRGRAYVAGKGADFYLQPLKYVPNLSAHQTLEAAMCWRELGLFEPCDAEFQKRFPAILREHVLWLGNRKHGRRARLCGRDLREVSWPKGALRGADLRGAILRNMDLEGDDLRGADLRWADLTAARLVNCRLALVKLEGALLDFALIPTSDLYWLFWASNNGVERAGVVDDGKGVWHDPAHRRPVRGDLSGCNLRGRVLRHLNNASNFDFTDCDLRGADLSSLNFDNPSRITQFRGADLRQANVWGANFNRCDLTGADLEDIKGADYAQWNSEPPRARNFGGVKWRRADLNRRNFAGCDLSGADLRGANLCFANFSDATLNNADLCDCKMVQANMENANLSRCDLRGVRLGATKLSGAFLHGARLSRDARELFAHR